LATPQYPVYFSIKASFFQGICLGFVVLYLSMNNERIVSYDIFRGVLLIGMMVFHVLVNLTPIKFNQELFYWIPMGFIMFLGVILGQFLVGKTRKKVFLGFKILIIFLIGNLGNFATGASFLYLLRGNQALFSFEILLPMSALIFLSIFLDRALFKWKFFLLFLFLLLVLLQLADFYSYNLAFLVYGLIGYFLGAGLNLDSAVSNVSGRFRWVVLFLAIAPFFLVKLFGLVDFVVAIQVLALFALCAWIFKKSQTLYFLGKNSLVLYVAHIVIIRVILFAAQKGSF